MKGRLTVALVLTVLLTAGGCAKPVTIDESKLVDITWVNWDTGTSDNGTVERHALFLPVRVGDKEALFQLDTGRGNTLLNRAALDRLGVKYTPVPVGTATSPRTVAKVTFSLGDYRREVTTDLEDWGNLDPPQGHFTDETGRVIELPDFMVGTLGNDLFKGASLYIDFERGKIAAFSKPPRVRGKSAPFRMVADMLPVLTLEGERPLNALFDTGSSALDLVVGMDTFREITGSDAKTGATRRLRGLRSGPDDVDLYGLPREMTYRTGELTLDFQTLWATPLVDTLDVQTAGQVDSIFGNVAFRSDRILLDFAAGRLTVLDPP